MSTAVPRAPPPRGPHRNLAIVATGAQTISNPGLMTGVYQQQQEPDKGLSATSAPVGVGEKNPRPPTGVRRMDWGPGWTDGHAGGREEVGTAGTRAVRLR